MAQVDADTATGLAPVRAVVSGESTTARIKRPKPVPLRRAAKSTATAAVAMMTARPLASRGFPKMW